MKLVIVESPTKAKTISKYLGKDYLVLASFGHVRDLPKSKLGVDVEHGFEPTYAVPAKSRPNVKELKEAAKRADAILFATDEDREGEAITWHLSEILGAGSNDITRITFHEITKDAIERALKHPRSIDMHLVDAQQARRILDRLVGYELSPLLWRNVRRGLSAGRVQSAALRLIVEREREIKAFVPQEYWTIEGQFKTDKDEPFEAKLHALDGKTLEKLAIGSKDQADGILASLERASWRVTSVQEKERSSEPPAPFTTSTLQQTANTRLGFTSKQTMMLAQRLYEGIELGAEGHVGLITYMRTDSLNLSEKFIEDARAYATKTFGEAYVADKPRTYKTKSKGAQEAHEAIRPTEAARTPDELAPYLEANLLKLYRLIWERAVATQMEAARLLQTSADISGGNAMFRATGQRVVFEGYLKLAKDRDEKDRFLPALAEHDQIHAVKIEGVRHETEPPARYSDATLVKALEEDGVGRPSTYASIISTLIDRNYVERDERKRLTPTDVAYEVNDLLVKRFPDIVDLEFTARLEASLDKIADGEMEWRPLLSAFYGPFHRNVEAQEQELAKESESEASGQTCEKCGKPMTVKHGRYGKFLACTGYPECKNTKPLGKGEAPPAPEPTDQICEACGAPMVKKVGRFGPFLSCSRYPDCKTIKSIEKKTGVACPKCGTGELIEKRTKKKKIFYSCNRYPECDQAFWDRPTEEKCPTCGWPLFAKRKKLVCEKEGCGYSREREEE